MAIEKSARKSRRVLEKITVGHFYTQYGESMQLKLLAGEGGLTRKIKEGAVNRPGLALAGFYEYFASKRIQVIGSAETSYLNSLKESERRKRLKEIFHHDVPCFVFTRSINPPKIVLEEAEKNNVAIFRSSMATYRFLNAATIFLDSIFAPQTNEHGSMIEIQGVGVMVRGKSGIGKSECVLSLIERGHSLVSDDVTRIRLVDRQFLICNSLELNKNHMEVRGLGIINMANIFGVRSIRSQKELNLVVTLKDWDEVEDCDRLGIDQHYYQILGINVPHVIIPVRTGRDLAGLVEVASFDQKLKAMGKNSAIEFNKSLLQSIQNNTKI